MSTTANEELFRYVRVRGLTRAGLEKAKVVTPPAGLRYQVLAQRPESAGGGIGLPLNRASTPDLGTNKEALARLEIADKAVNGELSITELMSNRVSLSDEAVAWVWDSLGLALLDTRRHDEVQGWMNTLRIQSVHSEQETANMRPEVNTLEDATALLRSVQIHLPTFRTENLTSDTTSALEANPGHPGDDHSDAPAHDHLLAEVHDLSKLLDELHLAPIKQVEEPLAANVVAAMAESQALAQEQALASEPRRPFWQRWFSPDPEPPPPAPPPKTQLVLRQDTSRLSADAHTTIARLNLAAAEAPEIQRAAEKRIHELSALLAARTLPHTRLSVRSGMILQIKEDFHTMAGEHGAPKAPTRCSVRVNSVAEFIRVEQTLDKYLAGELSHIENILQGEMKERLTRNLTRSEQTLVEESEREETTERENKTDTRFEMEKESERALKDSAEKHGDISASLSATNGTATVVVEGSLGFSTQTSKEESEKSATKFSQNVTTRALDRVKKRVFEQRTTRMLKEFEDTSRHVLDNRGGDGHVVGAYRWVDKIYTARAMNYGSRVAIEVLVENPGRFLRPLQGQHDTHLPPPLDDQSHPVGALNSAFDIKPTNFTYFAALYGADVKPPPARTTFVTAGKAQQLDGNPALHEADEVEIPEGYKAVHFWGTGFNREAYGKKDIVRVYVGNVFRALVQQGIVDGALPAYTGMLAYGLQSLTLGYTFVLSIECELLPEAFEAWQLATYRKIRDAYEQAVHDAHQSAAQEQARQGINIQGRNPLMNEEVIRTELKKAVISALCVGEPFWLDEGVYEICEANHTTLPRLDKDVCAKLKLASLLESAIDWKLMTYQLLPYYWENACNWQNLMGMSDSDPLYAQFLQAGAGRVVVPLANGQTAGLELLYFLTTGKRWQGSDPPPVTGSSKELAAILEGSDDDKDWPQEIGKWEVKVPTSMTVLESGSACVDGAAVAAKLEPLGQPGSLKSGSSPE